MSDLISIGLVGASGRMGQWITRLLEGDYSQKGAALTAKMNRSEQLDQTLPALFQSEVVIDFSLPETMSEVIKAMLASQKPLLPSFVIGSTGWEAHQSVLTELAKHTLVLQSSNFSLGVLAFQRILKSANPILSKLGYTPVLTETHHIHKKDAPSGTAITLQKIINPENPSQVQTHAIRAGEIIGTHDVTFYSSGDRISLTHSAQDRSVFARGALECALWIAKMKRENHAATGAVAIDRFLDSFTP